MQPPQRVNCQTLELEEFPFPVPGAAKIFSVSGFTQKAMEEFEYHNAPMPDNPIIVVIQKNQGDQFGGFPYEFIREEQLFPEAESEILVIGAKKGFKIGFVEIPTKYDSRKSKMRPFKTIVGFLKVIINK